MYHAGAQGICSIGCTFRYGFCTAQPIILTMNKVNSVLFRLACVSVILIGFQNCAGGLPSMSEAQSTSTAPVISISACRSGFWSVSDGHLCMESTLRQARSIDGYNSSPQASTSNAIYTCMHAGPGARVCTHNDFQQACGSKLMGGLPDVDPYGGQSVGVYGDHASIHAGQTTFNPGGAPTGHTDDVFLTWNGSSCSANNDGPGRHEAETSLFSYRCCY